MGVVAQRLVFLGFVGLTGSIIYNALYLQEPHGTAAVTASGKTVVAPVAQQPIEVVKLPPVSTDLPPLQETEEGGAELLLRAVQRELAARGYDVGAENGKPSDKTTSGHLPPIRRTKVSRSRASPPMSSCAISCLGAASSRSGATGRSKPTIGRRPTRR